MRAAIYDRVEPPALTGLPVRLTETCSRRAAAALLVVTIPLVLAAGIAALVLLEQALFAPAARAVLAQHPALGPEILAAIAVCGYLLVLPISRLFQRMTLTRIVAIDDRTVAVTEGSRFRTSTWSAPLGSYTGLAHHLRASLSGTRHELILVHPEREKCVLLSLAGAMSQGEVDRVAALLGQKEIPSSELYRFRLRMPRLALPTWRHAAAPSTFVART